MVVVVVVVRILQNLDLFPNYREIEVARLTHIQL
jgi:hypothetical protein